ncbi:spexin [Phyllobates terribilis]|uniref:spexin n=1 Tax=Phyllobates terribilis TaxID=111132 RepID=UPI003CCB16EB
MKDSAPVAACTLILLMSSSVFPGSGGLPQSHFQRRNWTPQAMLYLKGAQGRRFISDESQRKDLYDRLQLETRSRNTSPITISEAAAMFLSSLQKAQEEADDGAMEQAGYLPDPLFSW